MGENARRDIVLTLEDMGFRVESSYHEVAPGQHEIDFHRAKGLESADSVMTFKFAVRTIARRHGLHATFMPKPKTGVSGSRHASKLCPLRSGGKEHLQKQRGSAGTFSGGLLFIGGILKHISGMSAITNPLVNSYKRLVPGFEAPLYEAWSAHKKNSLIRIPAAKGGHKEIELRSPDPAANPYLALAVCLMAGIDGIQNKILPPAPVDQEMDSICEEEKGKLGIMALPSTLREAITAMEEDPFIRTVLGDAFVDRYVEAKKSEWKEYMLAGL